MTHEEELLDEKAVLRLLRDEIKRAGSAIAWAINSEKKGPGGGGSLFTGANRADESWGADQSDGGVR